MTPHALLFTLAAIGISETAYLINKRRLGEKPVCPIAESNCHIVLESKYNKLVFSFGNKIFWIHNDILGILFYIAVTIISASLVIGQSGLDQYLALLLKVLIITGVVMSAYFTFLQGWVIKAWCFWCLMSAATVFLMLLIVLTSSLSA